MSDGVRGGARGEGREGLRRRKEGGRSKEEAGAEHETKSHTLMLRMVSKKCAGCQCVLLVSGFKLNCESTMQFWFEKCCSVSLLQCFLADFEFLMLYEIG